MARTSARPHKFFPRGKIWDEKSLVPNETSYGKQTQSLICDERLRLQHDP